MFLSQLCNMSRTRAIRDLRPVVFPNTARGLRRVPLMKVWRTERPLGRGSFGEVRLQSQESDKDVKRALKIIWMEGHAVETMSAVAEEGTVAF